MSAKEANKAQEFKQTYQNEELKELKVLSSNSLKGISEYVKRNNPTKILILTGAGVSTSAGIPDFRTPGTGLYDNLAKYKLPYPQAIFEIDYFRANPQPFFTFARELYPGSYYPTQTHYFIKLLDEKGLLLRNYTQNIDTLESVAGISPERVIEAHGSFKSASCVGRVVPKALDDFEEAFGRIEISKDEGPPDYTLHKGCRKSYPKEHVRKEIFADRIPKCSDCEGLVKPDIVFFGESLPHTFLDNIPLDFPKADLLLILGTSLAVAPFNQLINYVDESCPRLLINMEKVGEGNGIRGFDFNGPRDAFWQGSCDDGVKEFCKLLGWEMELQELMDQHVANLKKEGEVACE